jgi:spore coat polysaccharide biosynthesis protein SpsF (cytidylyltransferase family)
MILTFVPCRLKSTRLPNKAIRDIAGIPAIERCFINVAGIRQNDKTVLITSTEAEDDALLDYTLKGQIEVFRGPVDDVLERVLPAIDKYEPEHVIRVTGDCPLVSFEMAEELINAHIESGADATYPKTRVALGSACEIYKTSAIRKLRSLFPTTNYSEYLIYYFSNNPGIFKINEVDVADRFKKPWRLTLDEQNDLELLNLIYSEVNPEALPVAFNKVEEFFTKYPEATKINVSNEVKYRDNQELIALLKRSTTHKSQG